MPRIYTNSPDSNSGSNTPLVTNNQASTSEQYAVRAREYAGSIGAAVQADREQRGPTYTTPGVEYAGSIADPVEQSFIQNNYSRRATDYAGSIADPVEQSFIQNNYSRRATDYAGSIADPVEQSFVQNNYSRRATDYAGSIADPVEQSFVQNNYSRRATDYAGSIADPVEQSFQQNAYSRRATDYAGSIADPVLTTPKVNSYTKRATDYAGSIADPVLTTPKVNSYTNRGTDYAGSIADPVQSGNTSRSQFVNSIEAQTERLLAKDDRFVEDNGFYHHVDVNDYLILGNQPMNQDEAFASLFYSDVARAMIENGTQLNRDQLANIQGYEHQFSEPFADFEFVYSDLLYQQVAIVDSLLANGGYLTPEQEDQLGINSISELYA